jgi:hypothetical protein
MEDSMLDTSPTEGKTPDAAEMMLYTMQVLLHWKPQIEKAMHHVYDMYSFNNVVAMVANGSLRLFAYPDCMVLMQPEQYPGFKTYHCFLACGDMQAIKTAEADINAEAKELGCQYMSISGRTGWPRALKSDGWDHMISVLYKETY